MAASDRQAAKRRAEVYSSNRQKERSGGAQGGAGPVGRDRPASRAGSGSQDVYRPSGGARPPGGGAARPGAARDTSPYSSSLFKQYSAKNAGNDLFSAQQNDLTYNSLSAYAQTKSDAYYADTMTPRALNYQRGAQSIMTEASMKEKAADAAIARDLTAQTGQINTGIENIRADTLRYGADSEERTSRYSEDSRRATGQDRNASEERQIGLEGQESRANLRAGTDETLRLRADARGAIRTAGARFYG